MSKRKVHQGSVITSAAARSRREEDELRALIREAHEVAQNLAELCKHTVEARQALDHRVKQIVQGQIADVVLEHIEKIRGACERAAEAGEARVMARMEALEKAIFQRRAADKLVTLEDLVSAHSKLSAALEMASGNDGVLVDRMFTRVVLDGD